MTSIASPYRPPISPPSSKKRVFADVGTDSIRQPKKRLQSVNLPSKFSGAILRPSVPVQKSAPQFTGLEGYLKLDLHFIESTKATEEDEAKRTVQDSSESSYKSLLTERRRLANKIPASWQSEMKYSGRGLKNFTGALCYRHSLFQALVHTPKFVYWLIDYHKPQDCVSDNRDDCISCQLRIFITMYWNLSSYKRSLVSKQLEKIHQLFEHLGWKTNSLNGHGDPDDQLAWMLGIMRSEMPSSIFSYFDAFHNSVLESEIKCGRCGHVSRTEGNNERHLSIPINVPDLVGRHLQLLVKAYMDEVIQGYRCGNERCKHVSDKHRIQKIAYAPDVLLIQLKRFNYHGQKDPTKVQYGSRLDLTPHSVSNNLGPLQYDLTAVISHAGSSSFGHYHCIAKSPLEDWIVFDDQSAGEVELKEALNPGLIDRAWTPYLLFYERNKASVPAL